MRYNNDPMNEDIKPEETTETAPAPVENEAAPEVESNQLAPKPEDSE